MRALPVDRRAFTRKSLCRCQATAGASAGHELNLPDHFGERFGRSSIAIAVLPRADQRNHSVDAIDEKYDPSLHESNVGFQGLRTL
ncbi:hypothetical protein [Phyllobacterium sp. K27]